MLLAGITGEQHFFKARGYSLRARKACSGHSAQDQWDMPASSGTTVRKGKDWFMHLRILSLVWLSALLAVPRVYADGLPSPAALGQMESLLDSCSKTNPQLATKKKRELLVKDVSEKDLAKVRATDEYQTAYKEFSDRFEGASKDEAMKACKVLLGNV